MNRTEKLMGLWDRVTSGDQQAFKSLHKELYAKLYIYALNMLRDGDVVDDLLQDLFVKFWESKGKIGSIKNVEAYFYRSTRSMVLNLIKQLNYKTSKLDAMTIDEHLFSAEDIMVSKEADTAIKSALSSALNSLPLKQREILVMRFFEDLGYAEIANSLGIRYQSVINHVYRATQFLKHAPELADIHAA